MSFSAIAYDAADGCTRAASGPRSVEFHRIRGRLHPRRVPTVAAEIDALARIETHAFALEAVALGLGARDIAARRDAALSVDDPMPGHRRLGLAAGREGPAHMPGDPR